MTHEYNIALVRGLITAIFTFASAFLTALAAGVSAEKALIAGGGAGIAVLMARFGAEGGWDSHRNAGQPLDHDPEHL